jgi:hypothetical protein
MKSAMLIMTGIAIGLGLLLLTIILDIDPL